MAKSTLQFRQEIIELFLQNLDDVTVSVGGAKDFSNRLVSGMIDRVLRVNTVLRERKMPELHTLFSVNEKPKEDSDGNVVLLTAVFSNAYGCKPETPVQHTFSLVKGSGIFEMKFDRPEVVNRAISDGNLGLFSAKQVRRMEAMLTDLSLGAQRTNNQLNVQSFRVGDRDPRIVTSLYSFSTEPLISVAPHFVSAMGEALLRRNDGESNMKKLSDSRMSSSASADIMFNTGGGACIRLGIC